MAALRFETSKRRKKHQCVCVCVFVCVRERERDLPSMGVEVKLQCLVLGRDCSLGSLVAGVQGCRVVFQPLIVMDVLVQRLSKLP